MNRNNFHCIIKTFKQVLSRKNWRLRMIWQEQESELIHSYYTDNILFCENQQKHLLKPILNNEAKVKQQALENLKH